MSVFSINDVTGIISWILLLLVIVSFVDILIKRRYAAKFGHVTCAPYLPIIGSVPAIVLYGRLLENIETYFGVTKHLEVV